MPDLRDNHQRRSIRLSDYDYTQEGAYFVTICTHQHVCLFGDVIDAEVMLSTLGCVVLEEWERTALSRPYVTLDEFVVMPNHVHGIIIIDYGVAKLPDVTKSRDVGATRRVAQPDPIYVSDAQPSPRATHRVAPTRPNGPVPGSIGAIVGQFKSISAKRINRIRETPGAPAWQRNFYEHVIRDEKSLNAIREYIQYNPARWAEDQENPANVKG
jgi:REP element-mobilizing transposase RayT